MAYYKIEYAERYRNQSALRIVITYRKKPFAFLIDFDEINRSEAESLSSFAEKIIGCKIWASHRDLEDIRKEPHTYTGFIYKNINAFWCGLE